MKLSSYVIFFLCGALSISVKAEGIGMMTGGASGTYYKFGLDIKQVAKDSGVNILVKNSAGSIDNMRALTSSDNAALAIVQSVSVHALY